VLIVACPCGLALAAPFALGHALRFFDKAGLHLRDTTAIERLAALDALVFDKTGTLTAPGAGELQWTPAGEALSEQERRAVAAVAAGSAHPVSRRLAEQWGGDRLPLAEGLREEAGGGIGGEVRSEGGPAWTVRIGSPRFCGIDSDEAEEAQHRGSAVVLNGRLRGWARVLPALRPGAAEALQATDRGQTVVNQTDGSQSQAPKAQRASRYRMELLSGDQDTDRARLERLFPAHAELRFGVTPHDKLARIEALRAEGYSVGMFGDGLNDAGALAASDAGLAVADDLSGYFPASDGVLEAEALGRLPALLRYARAMRGAVWVAIGVSLAYNLVGLSFAVSGQLTPLVAAILMPISSLTVAGLGLTLAALRARHLRSKEPSARLRPTTRNIP
jgi:Cu+-exporting ATPase